MAPRCSFLANANGGIQNDSRSDDDGKGKPLDRQHRLEDVGFSDHVVLDVVEAPHQNIKLGFAHVLLAHGEFLSM